jgi:hypothetical protein
MADDGERRMLFDIRGRRKRVIQVVYAILALLMGASLFLVVGPVNLGELVGGDGGESRESVEIFDEQAERIEQRLRANPEDAAILISLVRARVNAGRGASEQDPTTGETVLSAKGREEYEQATDAWNRYLKIVGENVNPTVALLMSQTAFGLAQNSSSYGEAFEHLSDSAEAQRLSAEARPSVGSWATLAAYAYLAGEKQLAAKAGEEAKKLARAKNERKQIEKQLVAYRKQGEQIQKRAKQAAKAEQGQGKEALENPLGGLGGATAPAAP